jgi:DNA replication and repair protein RecF
MGLCMDITNIELENFRNYEKSTVKINSKLVLLLGDNASGKTNFIEGIYFLSQLTSFRSPVANLTKIGCDFFRLKARANNFSMEAAVQTLPAIRSVYKINEVKLKKVLWSTFRVVTFLPQDLNLFVIGPTLRRTFLNQALTQKYKTYALDLVSLEHVLKQRAALLSAIFKRESGEDGLLFWDEQLVELTLRISALRREYIQFIQHSFSEVYQELTGFKNKFELVYTGLKDGLNKQKLMEILMKKRTDEIRSGMNLIGPHRDDFIINKDEILNINNSSRGELRAQILTLKLLQARYLDRPDNKPIILLDDVFSELDEIRRVKLIDALPHHQVFITTTEEHHLPKVTTDAQILHIDKGGVVV